MPAHTAPTPRQLHCGAVNRPIALHKRWASATCRESGTGHPTAVCAESDALPSAHEIVAHWPIWNKLVAGGDFDDMTSNPAAGIRDDGDTLRWIPFTHDGSSNHRCVDLDPAENGTVGQVIRGWHDDEQREHVASRYAEWLTRVVAERGGGVGD
ncbi:SMI1/KNR4 family protein [Burkholderia puraquae]|uniref:SMI1/KNR4 family protein n=1 Tax=Burkholderia puraquae TaxID=1904757 RepID=UPI001FCB28D6|nr:SMI1/KNR4 family protein [Burkholderia puraquae]